MASDDADDVNSVCMRCGGLLPFEHTGDCPHCGKSVSVMGFDLMDNSQAAEKQLLEEVNLIRSTPPTCLASFKTTQKEVAKDRYDATVQWEIACKCGCGTGVVYGYREQGDDQWKTPLSFKCDSCSKQRVFFDERLHGYNRAFDDDDEIDTELEIPEGRKIAVKCPKCSAASLTVRLTFSNPSGSVVDLEDEPGYEERCQDFFDAFACECICASCGKKWSWVEYECA